MGVFNTLLDKSKSGVGHGEKVGLLERCKNAMIAGGIASIVGNPADLCLI